MGSRPGPRPTKGGQTEAGGLDQDGLEGNSSALLLLPRCGREDTCHHYSPLGVMGPGFQFFRR